MRHPRRLLVLVTGTVVAAGLTLGACGDSGELRAQIVRPSTTSTSSGPSQPSTTATPETTAAPTTVAPTTAAPAAPPPPTEPAPAAEPTRSGLDPNGLTTDGVAPLEVGDRISRAEELTGKPFVASPCAGLGWISDALPGLSLGFDGERFTQYITENPAYSTPSGVRVGMTVEEAWAQVPYAERGRIAYDDDALFVRSEGNVIVFSLQHGRIVRIFGGVEGITGMGC